MAKKQNATSQHDTFRRECKRLLKGFARQRPIRTGPLVISLFGDAIVPRGGGVWLGSMITALEPFGISDRLVRTSVFRLVKQDWLVAERIGRRSFYRLTDRGLRRFEEASRRIYAEPKQDWAGRWCLALIAGADAEARESIRRELGWLGFAPFSSNVLAHPNPNADEVESCLADLDGGDRVLLMDSRAHENRSWYLRSLVNDAWQLEALGERYAEFLERFRPVYLAVRGQQRLDMQLAFCARILLIHEYRRILLRDPSLPIALLPERWDGSAAYQLCRNLYAELVPPAERYLSEHVENEYGPLPPADAVLEQRFGGSPALSRTAASG